jgi:predicted esterase
MLHKQANELGLDTTKIGIGGFSAGGALAIGTAIEMGDDKLPEYASSLKDKNLPDFACLIYPGIHPDFIKKADSQTIIPPIFIINGNEDKVTPATSCIDLYLVLKKKNIKTEMHIYAKGGHGFDSGIERGNGIATWRDSFIAWLKDMEFMK